jgi:hypothetical protein
VNLPPVSTTPKRKSKNPYPKFQMHSIKSSLSKANMNKSASFDVIPSQSVAQSIHNPQPSPTVLPSNRHSGSSVMRDKQELDRKREYLLKHHSQPKQEFFEQDEVKTPDYSARYQITRNSRYFIR